MTLVLDTSGFYAALRPDEPWHSECLNVLASHPRPLVLSPFVLAEMDYLLLTRAGVDRELALLDEVARGAYFLAPFTATDIAKAHDVASNYADMALGLADASVLVLCELYDTTDVLTLDHRHFRAVTVRGEPMRLLPEDR